MGIKNKIKYWYTKPRSGKAFGFTTWILTDPKAMGILLIMGYIVAAFMFTTLFILAVYFDWILPVKIIMGIFALVSIRNLYKYIRFNRKTGTATNYAMNDVLNKWEPPKK